MNEVNVRVAVRVRPLLPKEKLAGETSCVRIYPSTNQLVLGKDRTFTFDNVLSSKSTQEEVYNKCIDSLVQSCFQGYNATVFAYGQTGSGKTHTIGGLNITTQTEEEFGIIPRAVKHIFQIQKANPSRSYHVKVSYIEIYREELRDLLQPETSSKDLHIREDDKGNTLIIGAVERDCTTEEEVMACVEQGSISRHIGATQMNEQSSRSHTIFTVFIEQKWTDGESELMKSGKNTNRSQSEMDEEVYHYMCAKFHFVDLAGSERAHKTGNIGDRFKESIFINGGLLSLGNVISALSENKKRAAHMHIPYRESKITRLLKDSLGGNAKTLMLTCISPSVSCFEESLNALKYANRAKNIKNKPIVNRDPHSIRFEEMQSEIKALREELQRQRTTVLSGTTNTPDCQQTNADFVDIKILEDKIVRLQTECAHYHTIAEEAYKQLTNIFQRDVLTKSMNHQLTNWLELMEEIRNKVPATLSPEYFENKTIVKLEDQLKQCQIDLAHDEEIFAEKSKEVKFLEEKVADLESKLHISDNQLTESLERQSSLEEKLVQQELLVQELYDKLKQKDKDIEELEGIQKELEMSTGIPEQAPSHSIRRAKSVPASILADRAVKKEAARNIHTSPALFSLERVMAGFRARSQLLVSQYEDCDDVCQKSDEDQSDGISPEPEPFVRNQGNRGTYRVAKPVINSPPNTSKNKVNNNQLLATDDEKLLLQASLEKNEINNVFLKGSKTDVLTEMNRNKQSVAAMLATTSDVRKKKLKNVELNVRQSSHQIRDLAMNIRLKEQLIKELVKSSNESTALNKNYQEKIKTLEREKFSIKQNLVQLQKAFQDLEQRELHDKAEKERLQVDFKKKMELAKTRLSSLQKKQKETEKVNSITESNEKRIHDLEDAIEKMRLHHEVLQRKLKEEQDNKAKLEKEMQREQQKMSELEKKANQQAKVLKVKTEEVIATQKRLRRSSQTSSEHARFEEQKRWLDVEIEKVLKQRQEMEELEKELERKTDIIIKKEAMMAEKSELEIKKLRSSQVISKDVMRLSGKLESMERKIEEKTKEMLTTSIDLQAKMQDELSSLIQGREKLKKQRDMFDTRLQEGCVLSPQEERRLIELDEALETLDAAIEYKNDAIHNKQEDLRKSVLLIQGANNMMIKLNTLSATEARTLLFRYFQKVIDLRDNDRKKDLLCSELEMKIDDQERMVKELEDRFQHTLMESDRKLTQQQHDYEKKLQVLIRQVNENPSESGVSCNGQDAEKDNKIHQLEKELFYYKKTSRDLKKKLRELFTNIPTPVPSSDETQNDSDSQNHHSTPTYKKDNTQSKSGLPPKDNSLVSKPSTPRSSRHRSQEKRSPEDLPKLNSARGSIAPPSAVPEGAPPIRISRKDLRRMSDDELALRKSAAYQDLADSLDALNNHAE